MPNNKTDMSLDCAAINVTPNNIQHMQYPYQSPADYSLEYAQISNYDSLDTDALPQTAYEPVPMCQCMSPMTEPELHGAMTNSAFMPDFLTQNIGKLMRVEFLIGNCMTDRVGRLMEVGASYILLQSPEQGSVVMCDLYSIKFATIVDSYYPGPIQL